MSEPGPPTAEPMAEPIAAATPVPARRRAWLRVLVLGVVAALISGSLAAVAGPDLPKSSTAAQSFVPVDGTALFGEQQTTTGGRTATVPVFTESARIAGSAILGGLDWTLATRVIGALNTDQNAISTARYWRTITTDTSTSSSLGSSTGGAALTRVYRVDGDIGLLAESGPQGGFSYLPALLELPADVRPGQTWRGSGTVGGPQITYTSEFSAAAGAAGCLEVTGTLTYAFSGQTLVRMLGRTWCAGGLVAETDDASGTLVRRSTVGESSAAGATRPNPATEDVPFRWTPERWTPKTFQVASVDPNFGEGQMSGTPAALPPVQLRSGLIVQAVSSADDLVAFAPTGPDRWTSRWRAHPGGAVLTLSQFGDVTVATTSARRMVGYDAAGVRRWTLATEEVITAAPARASGQDLAATTLGGEVLVVDAATGTVRWRTRPGSDVGLAPAVAGDVVAVADRAGSLLGLDLTDGDTRWDDALAEPAAIAARNGRIVIASSSNGALITVDGASGDLQWRAWYPGTVNGVTLSDTLTVLTGGDGLRAFDPTGRVVLARARGSGVSTDGVRLVLWGADRADVIDASARELTSFAIPPAGVGNSRRHLAGARGVYLFDSPWAMQGWTSD